MLRLRDLVKIYPGPVTALAGVSLDVPPGMFGLLGPNGAGKSTLMRIVAGLLEASSGAVELDGVDILAEPERVWERLGHLPQDFGFYPNLSGRDMLLHILRLKGVRSPAGLRTLADELLERVNLSAAAGRKVGGYSGGMRQRLGIAQALAGDPRLVIVDEPTAGLDPEERQRFYQLLAELSAERIVLLSTHIVEDVATLCPRFAVIREGHLLATTSPRAARAALLGAVAEGVVAPSELEALRKQFTVTSSVLFEGQARVRIYQPTGELPAGFQGCAPTLEDAYLACVRTGRAILPDEQPTTGSAT